MAAQAERLEAHRRFLDRYYGWSRHIYDVTRKYFLFGRDRALAALAADRSWSTLVEVGPGTGRNLRVLHRLRPDARLGGVEPSEEMRAHARERCPWASLVPGFAESADLAAVHGVAPDRVLYSYCLSMVEEQALALGHARRSLAPSGQLVVVDFADLAALPATVRRPLTAWLRQFHVHPLDDGLLQGADALVHGPGRYYLLAHLGPQPQAEG